MTEKPKLPGSTLNWVPYNQWWNAANVHAKPIPKKTFTAFEPVTLPTELSAYLSFIAATLLANVSSFLNEWMIISHYNQKNFCIKPGKDVPKATNEIAVTLSLRPIVQPKWDARSPITAVKTPIIKMETTKHAQPPQ